MRQFVTYSGRKKILLLVLLCLAIGTCDEPIVAPPTIIPPTIVTTVLPNAQKGEPYSHTFAATGGSGSYSWLKQSGTFPDGLTLSSGGLLSGTPTEAGEENFNFSVQVTSAGLSAEKAFVLKVDYALPKILTTELKLGTIGQSYADTLKATGGDDSYAWSIIGGDLPPGITLSPSGVFRGRARTPGEWALSIQVTSVGLASQKSLTLFTEYPDVAILTAALPDAEVGIAYSSSLIAQGGDGEYTWSLASGALPPGMSLTEAGEISGTPASTDTTSFSVRVNSGGQSADSVLAMEILSGPLEITTANLPTGEVGKSYDQTIEVTGGDGTNYTWSVNPNLGTLPVGLGLSNSGSITGTPTESGGSYFTVLVESGDQTANKGFPITIVDSLSISTDSLPDATIDEVYSQVLEAAGGSGSYAWTVGAGVLPAGLSLSTAGAITGTPTTSGTSSFLATVTSAGISTSVTLTITVNSPLSISTSLLPNGVVGSAYEQTLQATGADGTYSWALLNSTLPAGLTLTTQGVISGTPTAVGTSNFTVQVTSGGLTALKTLGLTIAEGVTVTTTSLPYANVGISYTDTLTAAAGDGNYIWSLLSDTLPAGLSLSAGGVIFGTPTAAGTSTFTVQVTSAGQTATKALSILVYEGLNITSDVMRQGSVGSAYADTLEAIGGDAAYSWSLPSGTLPAGLSLSAAGVISGTPTVAAVDTFSVRVASGGTNTSKQVSVEVLPALSISGTGVLESGIVGHAYSDTLSATGGDGSYTWSLQTGSLPTGVTLSSAGIISGTPTATDTASFTVRVSSVDQTADKSLSLTIGPVVSVTTTTLPDAALNAPYSHALSAAGGDGSYGWFLASGSLPDDLNLSADGTISGTPSATDTASFTVSVVSAGDTASAALTLAVTIDGENVIPFGGALTGLTVDAGSTRWTTQVPAGTSSLVIEMTGPIELPDLGADYPNFYVAEGTEVAVAGMFHDCGVTGAFPGRCMFEDPAPGTWSILIESTQAYSGISLSVNPTPQTLEFGGTLTGLSGEQDFSTWTMEVPDSASSFVIEVTDGTFQGSQTALYIARGTSVGIEPSQYDCGTGSYPHRCLIEDPEPGTWSILLPGYSEYHDVNLSVNPEAQTIPFGGPVTQISGAAHNYLTWTTEVPEEASHLFVELEHGTLMGEVWLYVAEGSLIGTNLGQYKCVDTGIPSRCQIRNPAAGTWTIMVEVKNHDAGFQGGYISVNHAPQTLAFGSALTNVNGNGIFDRWVTEVPEGISDLLVEMTNGSTTGDLNLYVAEGSFVGKVSSQYDCKDSGLPSRCLIQSPEPGPWSVMIEGAAQYDGVTLALASSDGSAPSIPNGLIATPDDGLITLTWNRNQESDLSHYNIYGGTSTGPDSLLTTIPAGTEAYTLSGLDNGVLYYLRLSAVDNAANESFKSSDVSAWPHDLEGSYSLSLNGNDYIGQFPALTDFAFAASMWFKTTDPNGSLMQWSSSDVGGSALYSPYLYIQDGRLWSFSKVRDGTLSYLDSNIRVDDGKWHMVTFSHTRDHGDFLDGRQELYLDGEFVNSTSYNEDTRENYLVIGASESGGDFSGNIDEISYWATREAGGRRALTIDGIISLYNDGKPTDARNDAGNYTSSRFLRGYWKLSENGGTTAYDITGYGNHGSISGATYSNDVPTMNASRNWGSISSGFQHTCGVTIGGEAYCWGDNLIGQLGNGTDATDSGLNMDFGHRTVPSLVKGELTWGSIGGGDHHTCGVTTNGEAYCWGDDNYGQLGNGPSVPDGRQPVLVSEGLNWASVSAGQDHTCGVTTSGQAFCWGRNAYGQSGSGSNNNNSDTNKPTPLGQTLSGSNVGGTMALISAGTYHTCGVTTSGQAYCWGKNDIGGALGDGTNTNRIVPTLVTGGLVWASISAGGDHTCGVTSQGEAYCWGENERGELGDGTTTNRAVPTLVSQGHEWASITTGKEHTCGITTQGNGFCWGRNWYGQLGNGVNDDSSDSRSVQPMNISGPSYWTSLSAGDNHTCGVTTGGEAYCWGSSKNHGSAISTEGYHSSVPVRVSRGTSR